MEAYKLLKPLQIDYEWDKGPMPSGYAQIKLRLQPVVSPSRREMVLVHPSTSQTGRARSNPYHKNPSIEKVKEYIPEYTKMALDGVRSGCKEALLTSLDHPIVGVEIIVEELIFDFTYSTEAAFHFAAKEAVKQLLDKAEVEGALYISTKADDLGS